MSSESLHAPRDRLSRETIDAHQAIVSLMEELDAVDWYRQRADDCDDPALKEILLHNMREEVEHAAMLLEWLRRHSPVFDRELRARLFTEGAIVVDEDEAPAPAPAPSRPAAPRGFTIGSMKEAP
ncbi:MAG: ferritin [Alphaproteobacteria bacterium]|nr:ferritin [Alphaproteobacteria bacterium]